VTPTASPREFEGLDPATRELHEALHVALREEILDAHAAEPTAIVVVVDPADANGAAVATTFEKFASSPVAFAVDEEELLPLLSGPQIDLFREALELVRRSDVLVRRFPLLTFAGERWSLVTWRFTPPGERPALVALN
jgi:hypothetical protein